jgi:hypothetical protein
MLPGPGGIEREEREGRSGERGRRKNSTAVLKQPAPEGNHGIQEPLQELQAHVGWTDTTGSHGLPDVSQLLFPRVDLIPFPRMCRRKKRNKSKNDPLRWRVWGLIISPGWLHHKRSMECKTGCKEVHWSTIAVLLVLVLQWP